MAADERAHVLDAQVALDDAHGQVAQLAADADDQAGEDQFPRREVREGELHNSHGNTIETASAPSEPSQVFLGLMLLRSGCRPKSPAERERRHVVHLHGEDQVEEIAVGVLRVRQKPDVSEHPADVEEPEQGQGDGLELPFGPVAENGHQQDQGNHKRGPDDEHAVPARPIEHGIRHGREHARAQNARVHHAGHPPVAIQSGRPGEFLEPDDRHEREEGNGREPSEEDAGEHERDHHQPPAIRPPGMADVLAEQSQHADHAARHGEQSQENRQVGQKDITVERSLGRHGSSFGGVRFRRRVLYGQPHMIRANRIQIVCTQPTRITTSVQSRAVNPP